MAEELHDGEAQCAAFIKKWELDAAAATRLRELAPDNQAKAFVEFAPNTGTQNVSGKFVAWSNKFSSISKQGVPKQRPVGALPTGLAASRSAASAAEEDGEKPGRTQVEIESLAGDEAVAAFIERWNLDDTASAMLTELTANVRLSVLEGFKPGSNTVNVMKRFKAYIGVMQRGLDVPEVSKPAVPQLVSEEALDEFIGRFSLDEEAVALLKELPLDARAGVVSTFKPGGNTRNMSARLKAFAQSQFAVKPQSTSNIKQFLSKWGLNGQSEEVLQALRPTVLDIVLSTFNPPHGTPDMGRELASLVRDASSPQYRPSKHLPTYSTRSRGVPPGGPLVAVQKQRAPGRVAEVAAKLSPEQDELIEKWGLDEKAVQALNRLPLGLQTEALAAFNLAADTTNASARFVAFLRRYSALGGASPNLQTGSSSKAIGSVMPAPSSLSA